MKYYSCDLIEHGIDFSQNAITLCCRVLNSEGNFVKLIDNYHGELLDLDMFFKLKREYRNKMKTGDYPDICKNCIYLEEKDYDDDDYISTINFNEGTNCNCKCVYCTFTHQETTKSKQYDVYPLIKKLAENNYLRQGGYISMAGGEPTLGTSFEKLIELFIEYKIQPIRVLTNGLIYSDAIAKGLKIGYVNILISIDAGDPLLYKWIKGVDCYDRVWNNIKRYIEFSQDTSLIKTKYIIIPTINDTKDEILKYYDKVQETGVQCVAFDIEMTWFAENIGNIPQELYNIVEFTVLEAKKRNLKYEPIDRVVKIIQKINNKKNLNVFFRGHKL